MRDKQSVMSKVYEGAKTKRYIQACCVNNSSNIDMLLY
jgi:hypothetical protein